jgi:hypothetical protein
MRPSAWVTLLVFVIFAAGVRAHSARASSKPQKAAAPAPATPSWVVEGWGRNSDEAIDSALEKAKEELAVHLRNRDPHVKWTPSIDYIREHLLADLRLEEVGTKLPAEANPQDEMRVALRPIRHNGHEMVEEEKDFGGEVGKMRRVHLKIALSPSDYDAIKQKQREVLSHQRQLILARGLAVAVVLLVTVVGYFRLEEATKGYYTAWLRLAAAGLIATVVAGLLLVA